MAYKRKLPNGHIFRGKDRLVKIVTNYELLKLKYDLAQEEENMFYLRHPYLTPEQSHGHAKALGKREERKIKILATNESRFKKNVTLNEMLGHLRYAEAWE